jgi:hypothetical protein
MTRASDDHIDDLILSVVSGQWRKVAFIVSKVLRVYRDSAPETSEDTIADRVRALVDDGKLEAQGNLSYIRHSEVRLPDGVDQEPPHNIHHS